MMILDEKFPFWSFHYLAVVQMMDFIEFFFFILFVSSLLSHSFILLLSTICWILEDAFCFWLIMRELFLFFFVGKMCSVLCYRVYCASFLFIVLWSFYNVFFKYLLMQIECVILYTIYLL